MKIKGLEFVQTCIACPEQYDVFDGYGNLVGYVRLRHGFLYCDFPDVGGETIYEATTGYGCFDNDEDRMYHLNLIADRILEKIG